MKCCTKKKIDIKIIFLPFFSYYLVRIITNRAIYTYLVKIKIKMIIKSILEQR